MAVDSGETDRELLLAGRYRMGESLAQGAICPVFRGNDTTLRRAVAIKVVPPEWVDAYRAALAATTTLTHPSCVALYDAVDDGSMLFLVQELVQGRPLSDYLTQGIPWARAVDLALQLARALDYIHRRGMHHGDLTPAAILVDRQATVRINNFGLPADTAYLAEVTATLPAEWGVTASTATTATGMAQDAAADIRAVGLLLWRMLSETTANLDQSAESATSDTDDTHDTHDTHDTDDTHDTRAFRRDVPDSLAATVRQACRSGLAPTDALPDAAALVVALEAAEAVAKRTIARVSTDTPPALRAARAVLEQDAPWAQEETQASGIRATHSEMTPTYLLESVRGYTPTGGPNSGISNVSGISGGSTNPAEPSDGVTRPSEREIGPHVRRPSRGPGDLGSPSRPSGPNSPNSNSPDGPNSPNSVDSYAPTVPVPSAHSVQTRLPSARQDAYASSYPPAQRVPRPARTTAQPVWGEPTAYEPPAARSGGLSFGWPLVLAVAAALFVLFFIAGLLVPLIFAR